MEELDLKELFNIFWNKKWLIFVIVLLAAVLGGVYSYFFLIPEYKSSTTLVLAKAESATSAQAATESITSTDLTLNSKLVSTYSELIKSKKVVRQVISNLGIDLSEDEVKKNVTVMAKQDTELIEITVVNKNAIYASKIANEIAKVFTDEVAEIYNINNVHVVDEAEIEKAPYNINHTKYIIIFALLGFILASAYILILNMLDTTVKTPEDIEKHIGVPVLASISIYDFEGRGGKK